MRNAIHSDTLKQHMATDSRFGLSIGPYHAMRPWVNKMAEGWSMEVHFIRLNRGEEIVKEGDRYYRVREPVPGEQEWHQETKSSRQPWKEELNEAEVKYFASEGLLPA